MNRNKEGKDLLLEAFSLIDELFSDDNDDNDNMTEEVSYNNIEIDNNDIIFIFKLLSYIFDKNNLVISDIQLSYYPVDKPNKVKTQSIIDFFKDNIDKLS